MMKATKTKATTNSTTNSTKKPALHVEDDFDKTFRPDESFDGVRVTHNESFDKPTGGEEWQVDLGAFSEGELASLLSAMSVSEHPGHNNSAGESPTREEGEEQDELIGGVETDQSSTGSDLIDEEEDEDGYSFVKAGGAVDFVEWEVLSTGADESVISLSSDVAIAWTYKDALKLGNTATVASAKHDKQGLMMATTAKKKMYPTPSANIHLQSTCRAREKDGSRLSLSQEFDADFVRDGVKMARGGCPDRMFKGNPAPVKKKKQKS